MRRNYVLWLVAAMVAVSMLSSCEKENVSVNCPLIGKRLDIKTGSYKYAYEFLGQECGSIDPKTGELTEWRNKATLYSNTLFVENSTICEGISKADSLSY